MTRQRVSSATTDQAPNALESALSDVLPMPAPAVAISVPEERTSLIGRLLADRETKNHREIEQVIDHVTIEAAHAVTDIAVIANIAAESELESEAEIERAIVAHRDSKLAMSVAPAIVQRCRVIRGEGVAQVSQAAISHISRAIASRRR